MSKKLFEWDQDIHKKFANNPYLALNDGSLKSRFFSAIIYFWFILVKSTAFNKDIETKI